MTEEEKIYVAHELEIKILDFKSSEVYKRLEVLDERLDSKFNMIMNRMDNQFKWTIGMFITIFGGMILAKVF
jgi:tetrahydromethanopterin S-methyltransferase subunit G